MAFSDEDDAAALRRLLLTDSGDRVIGKIAKRDKARVHALGIFF